MLPLNSGLSGLKEKRVPVSNGLALSDAATHGEDTWNRPASNDILLDNETALHVNHASDPGDSTLTMVSDATLVMVRLRGLTDALTLIDQVHVALEGYHAAQTQYSLTANETINIGQPVYVSSSSTVNLADADSINTAHVLGLAATDATANTPVIIYSDGCVERADWTSIVGSASLTPGAVYYLSTTAGQLTTAPPSGEGDTIVSCGIAVTTTKFDIEVNEVVTL